MIIWLAAAAILLGPVGTPEQTGQAIVSVTDEISGAESIGRVKAGMLCLPKGGLRWRDLARPALSDLIPKPTIAGLSSVPRALLDPGDQTPQASAVRVQIAFVKARGKLCVAGLGIGEKDTTGFVDVDAQVRRYDVAHKRMLPSTVLTMSLPLAGRDPRKDESPFREAWVELMKKVNQLSAS